MTTELLEEIKRLEKIANKYADLYYKYGGGVYSGLQINIYSQTFSFHRGSSTSGIGTRVSLPLSISDDETILQKLVDEQERKEKEQREKNTCKCCGNIKFQSNYETY